MIVDVPRHLLHATGPAIRKRWKGALGWVLALALLLLVLASLAGFNWIDGHQGTFQFLAALIAAAIAVRTFQKTVEGARMQASAAIAAAEAQAKAALDLEVARQASQREAIRVALGAELTEYKRRLVTARRYIEAHSSVINYQAVIAKVPRSINVKFNVYRENLGNIGLLDPIDAKNVVRAYILLEEIAPLINETVDGWENSSPVIYEHIYIEEEIAIIIALIDAFLNNE
ncbi:hypothetical protein [Nitrospirillum viridazoti]|uniref:hypothetical protein n=1 Tax=Nitrospirillum viridazoti TaxID=3144925 RepID=UPI0011A83E45|nr:hypothetical protein [Nitrospirillum amazonense]